MICLADNPIRFHTNPACLWVCLLALVVCFGNATPAHAQAAQDPANEENSEKEPAEEKVRPTIDLGRFNMRENRPTANETAKITFSMHLALPAEFDEKTVEGLQRWKHRLRNQVLIALRKTETKDFLEPNLRLLRRNILLRINRLLDATVVDEVLFTEYAFSLR